MSFDIVEKKKIQRNAIRNKMEELGFVPLHKSVFVYPFDCRAEIEMIRDFFGITKKDMCLIIADYIEGEEKLKKKFGL